MNNIKRVLITGKTSYIGTAIEHWLSQWPDKYEISKIDLRDVSWKEYDFSLYDVIFHVAGIAHVTREKSKADLYYKVNTELTIDVAKKAKSEGVKQFVFMSSIIVYQGSLIKNGQITNETIPVPIDFYGDSKLKAEIGLKELETINFSILIVRTPMVYGYGSKGNYPKLAKFITSFPFFFDFANKRSLIYIGNLCNVLKGAIDNDMKGTIYPQNNEIESTTKVVRIIAEIHYKKIFLVKWFNPIINILKDKVPLFNKVFGSMYYSHELSEMVKKYNIYSLENSLQLTEKTSEL